MARTSHMTLFQPISNREKGRRECHCRCLDKYCRHIQTKIIIVFFCVLYLKLVTQNVAEVKEPSEAKIKNQAHSLAISTAGLCSSTSECFWGHSSRAVLKKNITLSLKTNPDILGALKRIQITDSGIA